MKIFSLPLSYLLCILFSFPGSLFLTHILSAQSLDWTYENIIDDVQESGANPDVVMDDNGNLHVSYWQANEDRLKYGRRDASTGSWTHETLDVGDNFHGYTSAIALDPNGFVHIAYVKRIQSNAQIRYITNTSGSWQVEIPLPDDHIGKYGNDREFPVFAQASLDIFFQADGNPVILYFDGKVSAFGNCGNVVTRTYLDYDLDMNMLVKLNDGSWEFGPFDNIPDKRGQGCLLDGDRFGEFCQMLTTSDNRYYALTNSLHNHDMLLFSSSDLINWNQKTTDSTDRLFNTVNEFHFREGFEYLDADMLGDTSIHMIYDVANHYGNGDIFVSRRPLIYARFHPDSVGMPGYQPFYRSIGGAFGIYRSYSSIKSLNEDSIFVSFFDLNNSLLMIGNSNDGGVNWQYEEVASVQTNGATHLMIDGDSLRILLYDSGKDQMNLYSKAISGTSWHTEAATQNEIRGSIMTSKVTRSGGTDTKQIVFKEEISGKVYYGTSTTGNWTFEEVLDIAEGVEGLVMDLDNSGNPVFIYTDDDLDQIRIAWKQGTWNTRVIANPAKGRNLQFQINGSQYHVAYFDLNTGHLHYLSSNALTGPWNLTVIDSTSNIVGRGLDMAISGNGTIHLSYQDVINPKVKHAFLRPNTSWQVEDLTSAFNFNPNFTSIAINSLDLANISFHDATTNKIQLLEDDGTGWIMSEVNGVSGNFIGTPMDLILDDKDRPWILYNISDIKDEVALVRRDQAGIWNQVSINNNGAEIAQSFDFHLVEEDFYIIGKKNQLSNNGLGLLFAQRGVKTSIPALIEETQLSLSPNPARESLEVSFYSETSQHISLELYNLSGQLVHILQKPTLFQGGSEKIQLNIPSVEPGMYIFVWKGETYQIPQKLILVP